MFFFYENSSISGAMPIPMYVLFLGVFCFKMMEELLKLKKTLKQWEVDFYKHHGKKPGKVLKELLRRSF